MGLRVRDINGYAVLDGGRIDPKSGVLRGRLAGLDFSTMDQSFRDARANFVATHEDFKLMSGSVRLHGGIVRSLQPGEKLADQQTHAAPHLRFRRTAPPGRRLRARRREPRALAVADEDGTTLPRFDRRQGEDRPRSGRPELARSLCKRRRPGRLARGRPGVPEHLWLAPTGEATELRLRPDRLGHEGRPNRDPKTAPSLGPPTRRRAGHARPSTATSICISISPTCSRKRVR